MRILSLRAGIMAPMDDTRRAGTDPETPDRPASAGTGDDLDAALEALESVPPADAPDLADRIADRLGAMLAEEGEGADPATA
jgi:hypothetical protein